MNIYKYVVKKPQTTRLVTKTTQSECANNKDGVCSSNKLIFDIFNFIKDLGYDNVENPERVIKIAEKELNCDSESCVLTHPKVYRYISDKKQMKKELDTQFKPLGPRNSTKLLSNFNIDNTLILWAREYKTFYPCPFSMIDFNIYPNTFSKINLKDVYTGNAYYMDPIYGKIQKGFNCFACVLNTDVSSGRGKHWVCIFVDKRSKNEPWTIEYFNSTGNSPCQAVTEWMENQRYNLLKIYKHVNTVAVTNIVHQYSMTECGLYSLYYIRARLDNVPYSFFMNNTIPDNLMIEFRTHVFRSH
jgi:uncharacterized Zn-finger protein